jgi:hypothetical protein
MRSERVLRSGIVVKIRYSTAAINDLEEIGDYIAGTLNSPIAALNTVGKIQDAVDFVNGKVKAPDISDAASFPDNYATHRITLMFNLHFHITDHSFC